MGAEKATAQARAHAVTSGVTAGSVRLADMSSEELARRAQLGCRASFAELVHRYAPRLQAFLCHRGPDRHDAEDLVQDTFIKAYQNIRRYDGSWRFSTWLFTIATRLATSHRRRKRPRHDIVRPRLQARAADELAQEREEGRSLWALAAELPGGQNQALWLKYAEDMSVKEIARAMGKSQVCIKVLLYRARENLARRLREIQP
jgi:RNA polymerase sigma-70 factor (ECF subfamily)